MNELAEACLLHVSMCWRRFVSVRSSEVLSCDSHHKSAIFPMAIWKRENYVTRIAECNMVGCKFHAHELHLLDSIAWNSSFSFKCRSKAGCNTTENAVYIYRYICKLVSWWRFNVERSQIIGGRATARMDTALVRHQVLSPTLESS